MVGLLSDCKPAMRVVENKSQETYIAWVKGHKYINGNEMADKLSKEASILGHESEGAVTPAGLRACARRVRAEARGGGGGDTGVASQGDIGLHLVCHGERTTAEVATQNKETWWKGADCSQKRGI